MALSQSSALRVKVDKTAVAGQIPELAPREWCRQGRGYIPKTRLKRLDFV